MYQCTHAIVDNGKTIQEIDITDKTIRELIGKYREVKLLLTSEKMVTDFYLDISPLREIHSFNIPVPNWVADMDLTKYQPKPLEEADEKKWLSTYSPWDRNWSIKPGNHMRHDDDQDNDDIDKDDVILKGSHVDMDTLDDFSIVSVNGFIHRKEARNGQWYVINALKNMRTVEEQEMSIIDFTDIGRVRTIPINASNIQRPHKVGTIYEKGLYVKVPKPGQRTYLLVICGFLVGLNLPLEHFDNDILRVDLQGLCLERIVREAADVVGLKGVLDSESGVMNTKRLFHDTIMEQILGHHSTFLVEVDTPKLRSISRVLDWNGTLGSYACNRPVGTILQYGDGLVAEYKQFRELGRYRVNVKPREHTNLRHNTTAFIKEGIADDAPNIDYNFTAPTLYMRDIYSE